MKVILTKHAQERIKQRRMTALGVEQTVLNPDRKVPLENGETKFIKKQGQRLYQAVGVYENKQKAWIVLSAWVRGENDKPELLWRIIVWPWQMLWKLMKFLVRAFFTWQ